MRLNNVIIQPVITEKSTQLGVEDRYVFKVNIKATKNMIAENIEKLFGVNVLDIHTMIMPGKKRRILGTRRFTKTPRWKKAVVKLADGQEIDLFPKE